MTARRILTIAAVGALAASLLAACDMRTLSFHTSPASVAVHVVGGAGAGAMAQTSNVPLVVATPEVAAVVGPVPAAWGTPPRMRADAPPAPSGPAVAVLLFDEASAQVLYHHNGNEPLAPASLTKIATAIVAIERGDLDRRVTTDVDSRVMRGSTVMGLIPGDEFTVRDLLYGMMLPSGNDAALAIGRATSGSDSAFVEDMNKLAARLGLTETHFANPHGLNAPGHLTSAHDLALLSRYAMTLPDFRAVVTTTAWVARGSRDIAVTNVINDVLYSIAGADGVKSGYTRQAGRTLVASATRNGHRLYAVVLNDQQRLTDASALLEWGFRSFDWDTSVAAVQSTP